MGNCHAVDAVSATVEHPDGKVEKLYFSSSARQLMLQHPGHYVALLPPPPPPPASPHGSSVVVHHVKRKLKLLPPDSMLNVGSCYKLVSFEDVLSELSDNGSMAHQTTSRRSKQPQQVKVSEDKVAEGRQQPVGGVSKAAAVKHINQLRAMLSKSMFVSPQQHQQQHKENNIPQDVVPDLTRGIARSFSSPLESVRPVARGGVWRPNLQSIAERGR